MHANSTWTSLRHACHLRSRRVLVEQRPVKRFVDDEQFGRVDNADFDGVEGLGCELDDVLRRREPHRSGD
jgi:hypothetical protein